MKQLNINITKAQLKGYSVELEEGKPIISATVQLLTEGGLEVTTYTASTHEWRSTNKFELPLAAIEPIVKLAKILEQEVVKHCRDSQLALSAGLPTDPIAEADLEMLALPVETKEPVVVEDINDEPIDLDDIPF